jgi:hypothetical protein
MFGLVGLVAVILAASAALHLGAAPRSDADPSQDGPADWAGVVPGDKQASLYGPRTAPLTSSDYTSGFDKNAAGLGPLPETKPVLKLVQPQDARSCPDGLNCTFRPLNKVSALPAGRNVASLDSDQAVNQPPPPPPSGLGLLTANLHLPIHLPNRWPSANSWLKPANTLILKPAGNLLKPFANVSNSVSNSVVSFVKKL